MNNKLAFYRKYRPSCFKELIGQEFIVKTLQNSIIKNKRSHAYIFSGPRGVGKTSIAKIFSKALNCLESKDGDCCNTCKNCLLINNNQTTDVIELDAASNNGVNEVRNIIDTIGYLPNTLKTKVYIIDEAHMLSNAAWNAFLKSIEDPPSYLVFIFATTEPHKFPTTIISRCQRYNFLKLNSLELKHQIESITQKENIKIDKESINKLILLSDGSLRDACSLLDQLDSYTNSNITINDINKVFGLIDINEKLALLKDIVEINVEAQMKRIENYENNGANFYQLAEEIIEILFEKLVFNRTNNFSLLKIIPEININFVSLKTNQLVNSLEIWQKNLFNIKNTANQKFFFQVSCLEMTKIFDKEKKEEQQNNLDSLNQKINNDIIEQKNKETELKPKFVVLKEVMNKVIVEQEQNGSESINKNENEIKLDEIQNEIIEENEIINNDGQSGKEILMSILTNSIQTKHLELDELHKQFNVKKNKKEETKKLNKDFKETQISYEEIKKEKKLELKSKKIESKKEKISNEMNLFDIKNNDNETNFIVDRIQNIDEQPLDEQIEESLNVESELNSNSLESKEKNEETKETKPNNKNIDLDIKKIMTQVFVNKDNEEQKIVQSQIDEIKNKIPTNIFDANLKDIEKVVAVSKNGIVLLGKDKINIRTINNFAQSEDFLNFLKNKFKKIYLVMAISKKDVDDFIKSQTTKLVKKDIDDVDTTFLNKKIKNKKLAKDLAEEMLKDLIVEG